MFRRLVALLALALSLGSASPALAQSAPACQFILGFATLHGLDPTDTGDCIDNQAFAANGDAQQHTTNGLMAWRKVDNWTAFTNGYWTWIDGPNGLAKRLNSQRFNWEANPDHFALVAASTAPGQEAASALVAAASLTANMTRLGSLVGASVEWHMAGTLLTAVDDAYVTTLLPEHNTNLAITAPSGDDYVVILTTTKNTGTTTVVPLIDYAIELVDSQGNIYQPNTEGGIAAQGWFGYADASPSLNPNQTARVALAYAVPTSASGFRLDSQLTSAGLSTLLPTPVPVPSAPAPSSAATTSGSSGYQPAPTGQYPLDITAVCNDGTYSYSAHASGTCSHHGGVQTWVNHPVS